MERVEVKKAQSFTGHRDCVYALQPSSSPSVFFSGSGDGMIVCWDIEQPDHGALIAKLPNSVYALHYHATTNLLIVGHNYDGIHLLDWENKKEMASLHFTKDSIFDIQSAGNKLFAATGAGEILSIDIQSVAVTGRTNSIGKSARCIAVNTFSGELAVGFSDHYIRIFDLETLRLKHEWRAHANSVFTVRYSPDFNFLFSGSRDARLKVWDTRSQYAQVAEVVAHLYAINHLDFSPDGKHFVTCSMDKSIKVWDTRELKLLKVIDKARHAGHGTSVNKLLWTAHRSLLLSASDDRSISSWAINFVFPGS